MALPHPSSYDITEEEYLAFEQDSDFKHEFADNRIIAMAGASREHSLINGSTYSTLYQQLRDRPCEIYQSDMRVQIRSVGAYRYPDISVVCGTPEFAQTNPQSLLNPTVLIEVLSPSTAAADRAEKWQEYRRIPSLREYLLIAQDTPRVERYLKQVDINWLFTEFAGLQQQIELPSIQCVLALSDIYYKISFEDD